MIITLNCSAIQIRDDIHNQFNDAFGFPSFYSRSMDALIDCLSDADDSAAGMCTNSADRGTTITIVLDGYSNLNQVRPDLINEITGCIAFVNWRRIEANEPALFCIAYDSD